MVTILSEKTINWKVKVSDTHQTIGELGRSIDCTKLNLLYVLLLYQLTCQ